MKKKTSTRQNAKDIERRLKGLVRPEKAEFMPRFMQAYPGGYGEGDKFLGVVVPDQRRTAREFNELTLCELEKLLASRWHECRQTALFILVHQYEQSVKLSSRGKKPRNADEQLVGFYLDHLDAVNNWDLVDSSAHKILGDWVLRNPKQRRILTRLSKSKSLWRERVAVIATFALIRAEQFEEILSLAEHFLGHSHDLMHKAVGWMLREMGNRNVELLRGFLSEHVSAMPRTMLRYSIEKLSRAERNKWLGK